jgi:hypothetical protein
MKFEKYYDGLTEFEGLPKRELVAPWDSAHIVSIEDSILPAVKKCRIEFSVDANISDSSLGNKIEKEFLFAVKPLNYDLQKCEGKGYPDAFLRRWVDRVKFPFEIKSKSAFDRRDGNRQVFLSTSSKLRLQFPESPICHVFGTVFYSRLAGKHQDTIQLIGLALEFLEPWTVIEVRLEASGSQRLLYAGTHERSLVVPEWVQADCRIDTTVFETFLKPSEQDNINLAEPEQIVRCI